ARRASVAARRSDVKECAISHSETTSAGPSEEAAGGGAGGGAGEGTGETAEEGWEEASVRVPSARAASRASPADASSRPVETSTAVAHSSSSGRSPVGAAGSTETD